MVDDNSDARELIKRVLEDCAAASGAGSGASEALEMVQTQGLDVLVSDIGMPRRTGSSAHARPCAGTEHAGGACPRLH